MYPVQMRRLLFSISWTKQNYVWMKRSVVLAIIQCCLKCWTTAEIAEQSASEAGAREQYKPCLYSDKDDTSEDMVLAAHTALKKSCLWCPGICT